MNNVKIDGETHANVGGSQGYIGISIRAGTINDSVNGPGTPMIETAWMPTPAELAALNRGEPVIFRQLGYQQVPMMLMVQNSGEEF